MISGERRTNYGGKEGPRAPKSGGGRGRRGGKRNGGKSGFEKGGGEKSEVGKDGGGKDGGGKGGGGKGGSRRGGGGRGGGGRGVAGRGGGGRGRGGRGVVGSGGGGRGVEGGGVGRRGDVGRGGVGRGGGGRGGNGRAVVGGKIGINGSESKNTVKGSRSCSSPAPLPGQKGAPSHSIPESSRMYFSNLLQAFRNGDSSEEILKLPATLSTTDRKFCHELARRLGLVSKSQGKGESRQIIVRRPPGRKSGEVEDVSLPRLRVGKRGLLALQEHVRKFPPLSALSQSNSKLNNNPSSNMDRRRRRSPRPRPPSLTAEEHAASLATRLSDPVYRRDIGPVRSDLPAASSQSEVTEAIRSCAVTLVAGETGCGKSTQVPQFVLDDPSMGRNCSVIVTQPRRLSAISLAERVASERCEGLGETVGYAVGLDSDVSAKTRLTFLTPGVLLGRMGSDPTLKNVTHVVMDEVHERDRHQEFLMVVLRDLVYGGDDEFPKRPDLKIILMSATMEGMSLREYWEQGTRGEDGKRMPAYVPEITITGRTFPVHEIYLEKILRLTKYVDDVGGGESEMQDVERALAKIEATKQQQIISPIESNEYFRCVMCGREGFRSAHEFGTHVAFCDGTPFQNGASKPSVVSQESEKEDDDSYDIASVSYEPYAMLEDRIRKDIYAQPQVLNDVYTEEYDPTENYVDQTLSPSSRSNDNHKNDCKNGKKYDDDNEAAYIWNGTGPFLIEAATPRTPYGVPSLADADALSRYQMLHDDEEVDADLVLEVLRYISSSSHGDGAVLVFLPGWAEIADLQSMLETTPPFNDRTKYQVLPLHSGISSREQRRVFQKPPFKTCRKIILSTNVAETSITIADVAFVIDSGRVKEKGYDPHLKSGTLAPTWISRASAKQRRGRAGRTRAGVCFHLFSRERYANMKPYLESELLRTPLEEICLQCKKLGLADGGPDDINSITNFLGRALSEPHPKSITNAISLLTSIGAMDAATQALTPLGERLADLTLEPRVGKMLIWSHLLGVARDASTMAVAMSHKSPFVVPPTRYRKAANIARMSLTRGTESDQMTAAIALDRWNHIRTQGGNSYGRANSGHGGAAYKFCSVNYLGVSTLQMLSDLRKNVANELSWMGFPSLTQLDSYHNQHIERRGMGCFHSTSTSIPLLQASICVGLFPNIAVRRQGDVNFMTADKRKAKVHRSSINYGSEQLLGKKCTARKDDLEMVIFGELVMGTHSFTVSDTSRLVSPMALLLLCGSLEIRPAVFEKDHNCNESGDDHEYDHKNNDKMNNQAVLTIDGWISYVVDSPTAQLLGLLRKRLDAAFLHFVKFPKSGIFRLTAEEHDAVHLLACILCSAHDEIITPRA